MLSYQFTDIVVCLISSLLKYAAARINDGNLIVITVSTRPRRGGCQKPLQPFHLTKPFQHTAARRRLQPSIFVGDVRKQVSTHSHPKVAACGSPFISHFNYNSFNTQPPEGGCLYGKERADNLRKFQHTATRRWLPAGALLFRTLITTVSTHSHPKVAAAVRLIDRMFVRLFQHTATRRWLR